MENPLLAEYVTVFEVLRMIKPYCHCIQEANVRLTFTLRLTAEFSASGPCSHQSRLARSLWLSIQGLNLRSLPWMPVKLSLGISGNCIAHFASIDLPKRSGKSQPLISLTNAPRTWCYPTHKRSVQFLQSTRINNCNSIIAYIHITNVTETTST